MRTLIQRLLSCSDYGVSTNDIGVIAPYRKQVQKIRLLLRKENLGAVRVGTVDDYQGQEERVIIISTTLSNTERLNSESENSMGFLSNERRSVLTYTHTLSLYFKLHTPLPTHLQGAGKPAASAKNKSLSRYVKRDLLRIAYLRRFNVALTRATSLCIIVGNPFLMLARPHWKSLLQVVTAYDMIRQGG